LEQPESAWQSNVTQLTKQEPSTLSAPEIKVLLSILAMYLATAPSYESQQDLQAYISLLREQLSIETNGPQFVVRPP
jgi:hypothetical protein